MESRAVSTCMLLIVLLHTSQSEEVFRSVARLRGLVDVEHKLVTALHKYINVSRELLRTREAPIHHPRISGRSTNLLESRLQESKHANNIAITDIDHYVTHPVHAFQMLTRFMKWWYPLRFDVDPVIGQDILSICEEHNDILPKDSDLTGASLAILRLQSTYVITTRDMADSNFIQKTNRGDSGYTSMSVSDCFRIGEEAYLFNDNHYCVQWMDEALRRYREGYPIMPWEFPTETTIIEFKAYCYYRAGLYHNALRYLREIMMLAPDDEHALANLESFESGALNSSLTAEEESPFPLRDIEFDNYQKCCRGEVNQPRRMTDDQLICRYLTHPLLILRRVGEEVVHVNPRIVTFHGVIDDHEVDALKQMAIPKLHTSMTITTDNTSTGIIQDRVSNTAWLNEEEIHGVLISKLNKRLEAMTGLSADNSEAFQVLNYGIGGHYSPHMDSSDRNPVLKERVATLLIYLSDVEYGGGTVFVRPGVRANARKGNAAFWFNLHKNGNLDPSTEHGGCPVLVGEKWIINKWFNYGGQIFNRKCGMSPDE